MHEHPIANGSRENIAHLSHSLEMALGQNRALLEDMVRFTRDESLRLARMQLDHAGNAFAQMQDRHDLGSLIGAQQEWIRQTMHEYAGLSLRYAEMFHTLAKHVQSHVKHTVSDLQHQTEEMAEDLGQMQNDAVRPHNGAHVEHPHMPAE